MASDHPLKPKELLLDIAGDFLAATLFAVSTQVFNAPSNIAPGGLTGISIILNYLFGLPISVLSLAMNIPLLLLAYFFVTKRFTFKTLKTVIILTAMLTVVEQFMPVYTGERILAALAGGVLSGAALAVCFMRSSSSGGTDIVARLIQRKYPDLPVGRLLLYLDGVILLTAGLVYRDIESILFALVGIYTKTQMLNSILYGMDVAKVLMVVTSKPEEVAKAVNIRIRRGCTMLDARGSYTKEYRPVLMCVVRPSQYYDLKKLVNSIDSSAFIISLEAAEIIGKGFKSYSANP